MCLQNQKLYINQMFKKTTKKKPKKHNIAKELYGYIFGFEHVLFNYTGSGATSFLQETGAFAVQICVRVQEALSNQTKQTVKQMMGVIYFMMQVECTTLPDTIISIAK